MENIDKLKFEIASETRALVVGAGHGIGLAVIKCLSQDYGVKNLYATFRRPEHARELQEQGGVQTFKVDPTNEDEVEALSKHEWIKELDLIFICVGALQYGDQGPEKSVRNFSMDFALENFRVNTLVTPLMAKYLLPKLSRSKPISWASISAKVGSIGDNALGGWHSYRASKCALNMYLANLSIEALRGRYQIQFFALHPGTVETSLSAPYLKNVGHKVFSTNECAQMLLAQLAGWSEAREVRYIDYKGEVIPW